MKVAAHHIAAETFPMMDADRFSELTEDINRNGVHLPVVLAEDGSILDGRNRYKACQELGITPPTTTHKGNPWTFVWSLNCQRRDLVAEQRYLIWKHCAENSEEWQAERAKIKDDGDRKRSEKTKEQHKKSKPRAGETLVVEHSVPLPKFHIDRKAKATASKTNAGAVLRGDLLASNRPDLAENVRLGKLKPTAAHRQMTKDAVGEKIAEIPAGKFRVLYADPPWSYNDKQGGTISASYGAAEKHYPSMATKELCEMPITDRLADDAVLFLWTTSPLLPDGLKVLKAWGFKYKASFIWDKVRHNMGHYNSVRHEFLLVATRGSCTPEVVKLFDSVQSIERSKKHSQKPAKFREIIDTLYPNGKRLELFAREKSAGWEVFGNES